MRQILEVAAILEDPGFCLFVCSVFQVWGPSSGRPGVVVYRELGPFFLTTLAFPRLFCFIPFFFVASPGLGWVLQGYHIYIHMRRLPRCSDFRLVKFCDLSQHGGGSGDDDEEDEEEDDDDGR